MSITADVRTPSKDDHGEMLKNQKIVDGFKLNWMKMKDGDKGRVLWQQTTDFSRTNEVHEARIPKRILKCKSVCRELNFSSKELIENFSLVQRIYFKGRLMEEWPFHFGFVMPNTTNSWENVIEADAAGVLGASLLSGNIEIETLFFNESVVISKSRVRVFYV
ncbi:unnamed protein product [Oikopleura dioica]|uniref:GMP phosphodiesterase delta subunit domain-containing protein n=1 Tax=Oikopleura dioica TaxID=34765 RepID=E4Y3R8_OIKDI|nr:unnamed protein product [Oikopleura dioica]